MKRSLLNRLSVPAMLFLLTQCAAPATEGPPPTVIGHWATSNLDVAHYRNGDPIPNVTDSAQWASLTTGAWTYYDNDSTNRTTYGRLYNWYALADPRGICPLGWHVATDAEWDTLVADYGGADTAGAHLKASEGWNPPNVPADNLSGFTALPSGNRKDVGIYNGVGVSGPFWTATEADSMQAVARFVFHGHSRVGRRVGDKRHGLACRCVKDDEDGSVL